VAVITGGFGLLGSELAASFLSSSAQVAILDVAQDAEKLGRLRRRFGPVRFYPCDIASPRAVASSLRQIGRDLGKIDILVNNAYPRNKNYGRLFEKIELKDWQDNVNRHLGGYFNVTQQVARLMRKRRSGSIINIGSIYGMVAPDFSIYKGTKMTMPAEYAAIKGGLINLTRYLATYLAPYNIRVNAVSPGGLFNGQDRRFVRNYSKKVPLGRMGNPGDVCGAVIFLASDAARYITGQNIAVDGGWTAW
jgi:NAD(P)-dependent dehydrogenase (short-subunit alcohol dehydrogenase family)